MATLYDYVDANEKNLTILRKYGFNDHEFGRLELYREFRDMRNNGELRKNAISFLADKYHVSEVTVERTIRVYSQVFNF